MNTHTYKLKTLKTIQKFDFSSTIQPAEQEPQSKDSLSSKNQNGIQFCGSIMSPRHEFLDNTRLGWYKTTPGQSGMCLIGEYNQEFTGHTNNPKRRYAFKTVVTKAPDETILKME